jgi:hypothetical protein
MMDDKVRILIDVVLMLFEVRLMVFVIGIGEVSSSSVDRRLLGV